MTASNKNEKKTEAPLKSKQRGGVRGGDQVGFVSLLWLGSLCQSGPLEAEGVRCRRRVRASGKIYASREQRLDARIIIKNK